MIFIAIYLITWIGQWQLFFISNAAISKGEDKTNKKEKRKPKFNLRQSRKSPKTTKTHRNS